jgi:hypothetical protein
MLFMVLFCASLRLCCRTKKARSNYSSGLLNNPGDFLLSHAVSRAVPSAPAGLTSVFGMGTGVTLPTKSPENFSKSNSDCFRASFTRKRGLLLE